MIALVFVASLAGGLVASAFAVALLWLNARRVARMRGPFMPPARIVVPAPMPHAQRGSLAYLAHVVERCLPAGLVASFKATDDPRIPLGHVVVTFSIGQKGKKS